MSTDIFTTWYSGADWTGAMAIPATLSWEPEKPLSLKVSFGAQEDDETIAWEFGRDLFREALAAPGVVTGLGDVQVLAGEDRLALGLSSPHGAIDLWTRRAPVEEFLGRTYAEAPHGRETLEDEIDRAIAALLQAT